MRRIRRALYDLRWHWWYMFTANKWPTQTLYFGPGGPLDRDSRRIIIERARQQAQPSEPMFEGGYPNRRQP